MSGGIALVKSETVIVQVPATTANCGPGFDALGIACNIYNKLELTLTEENKIEIEISGEGVGYLPINEKNLIWKVVKDVIDKTGAAYNGAVIKMHNDVPLSRGLGSSAAAIVAGIVAANYALGEPFNKQDVLEMATAVEGHPDNVAPAIFGGMTVSLCSQSAVKTISFLPKLPLKMIVAVPKFFLSTKKARKALPESIPIKDASFNIAHVASLVAAMCTGNADVLSYAFDDKLHQPYRAELIPGMYDVFAAAKKAGALGAALSGAGPSLIAFSLDNEEEIGRAMVETFSKYQVPSSYLLLNIDTVGTHRIG
ncbi:homoserine kinase [Pectinatus cerevisiiphilus]|uniref:Homoserine kinase n=1 Tax=Pectinatus cerevisiiphilus TaxID=86956 RepID=A0A4R3K4B7_9FIRM|nr:homoserine kinase [Pectinatus cerevisiiphilus]